MVPYSQLVLGILLVLSLASCLVKKPISGNHNSINSTVIVNQIDSLLSSFDNTPTACIQILALASEVNEYLPDGRSFEKLNQLKYEYENGDILECVCSEVRNNNQDAKTAILKYLNSYYESILVTKQYSHSSLFEILAYLRNPDALDLITKLSIDKSIGLGSGHGVDNTPVLAVLGQGLILARIESINGQYSFREVFLDSYHEYLNNFNNPNCGIVDRWEQVVLPILNKAIKENKIEYVKYSGPLKGGKFNSSVMGSNPCRY